MSCPRKNATTTTGKENVSQPMPEQLARAPKRRMGCVDCHNRPTHVYVPPDRAVNEALVAGRIMKIDWRTHPDKVGHYYFQGCFRCHDGRHRSAAGRVIRADCDACHTVLDQTRKGVTAAAPNGEFRHPVNLGGLNSLMCGDCHNRK